MLRPYVVEMGDALDELDELRERPTLDHATLADFAVRHNVREEMEQLWEGCGR
jgi:hypothetical protein